MNFYVAVLSVFVAWCSWAGQSLNAPKAVEIETSGLIIRYAQPFDAKAQKSADRLHAKAQMHLVQRLRYAGSDLVSWPQKTRERSVASLCRWYLSQPGVSACKPNQIYRIPNLSSHDHGADTAEADLTDSKPGQEACEIVPRHGRGRLLEGALSPFWAQEYIGADLAKSLVLADPATMPVTVDMVDRGVERASMPRGTQVLNPKNAKAKLDEKDPGMEDHATNVANLIGAKDDVGIGAKVDHIRVRETSSLFDSDVYSDYLIKNKITASLMNRSMSMADRHLKREDSDALDPYLERLLGNVRIIVNSAGNGNRDDFGSIVTSTLKHPSIIAVGSLSPLALPDIYSSRGPEVVVLAPSSEFLASRGAGNRSTLFRGTSGATPLVTGALANALSFIPDLGADEARAMLIKTSIAVPSSHQEPRLNGAGMLNALKLAAVAQRLRDLCAGSKNKVACRKSLLDGNPSAIEGRVKGVFDFDAPSTKISDLKKRARALFKSCASNSNSSGKASSCADRRGMLQELRKTALLDGHNPELFDLLSCAYESEGYKANANSYAIMADAAKGGIFRPQLADRIVDFSLQTQRLANAMGSQSDAGSYHNICGSGALGLPMMGASGIASLEKSLLNKISQNCADMDLVFLELSRAGALGQKVIQKRIAELMGASGLRTDQKELASAVRHVEGAPEEIVPLCEKLVTTPGTPGEHSVSDEAGRCLLRKGGESGRKVFSEMLMKGMFQPSLFGDIGEIRPAFALKPEDWDALAPYFEKNPMRLVPHADWLYPRSVETLMKIPESASFSKATQSEREWYLDAIQNLCLQHPEAVEPIVLRGAPPAKAAACNEEGSRSAIEKFAKENGRSYFYSADAFKSVPRNDELCGLKAPTSARKAYFSGIGESGGWLTPTQERIVMQVLSSETNAEILKSVMSQKTCVREMNKGPLRAKLEALKQHPDGSVREAVWRCLHAHIYEYETDVRVTN